jgi:hypothetical protein
MGGTGKGLGGRPTWEYRSVEQLEEFDWDSLRRVWDDEEPGEVHEARAEQSLQRLNQVLARRRRNRRLVQVASVLLAPLALFLTVRSLRQAFA